MGKLADGTRILDGGVVIPLMFPVRFPNLPKRNPQGSPGTALKFEDFRVAQVRWLSTLLGNVWFLMLGKK